MVDMCKLHRETYSGRSVELKCQTKGCWESGIMMERQGSKFLERRVHLQKRLDAYEPALPGSVGAHRESRNVRDSSADTNRSVTTSNAPYSVKKGVSFEDSKSVDSDASSLSMPELSESYVGDAPVRPKRDSEFSNVSGSVADLDGVSQLAPTNAALANVAANLINRKGRRNSAPLIWGRRCRMCNTRSLLTWCATTQDVRHIISTIRRQ